MKKSFWIPAALSLVLFACKNDDHAHDSEPVITIHDPKETHYHAGDTAYVNVTVTDEHEMHEAECTFITRPQNDTLWHQKKHSHSSTITFDSYYVIGALPDKQEIEFIVTGENEAGKTVTATHTFEVHDH